MTTFDLMYFSITSFAIGVFTGIVVKKIFN